jgi:hypothetical protein
MAQLVKIAVILGVIQLEGALWAYFKATELLCPVVCCTLLLKM